MDDVLRSLAREARRLGLEGRGAEDKPERLTEFAQLVLEELVACGLLEGETPVGCWTAPRTPLN